MEVEKKPNHSSWFSQNGMDSQPDHKKNKSIGFERERTSCDLSKLSSPFHSSTTTPQGLWYRLLRQRSTDGQVLSGGVSTWLGDLLMGIPRVVDFLETNHLFWHSNFTFPRQPVVFGFFFCSCCKALNNNNNDKRVKDKQADEET